MRLKLILRQITILAGIFAISITALGSLFYATGGRVNVTSSIPLGIYWTTGSPVEKGAYVLLCPPPIEPMAEARRRGYLAEGFCPGHVGHMMKRILAAKDDVVTITDKGVTVNGLMIPLSEPMVADRWNRPMPRYQHTRFVISENEVLVMGDVNKKSFDSRYFGPILRKQIETVIVPVITW